MSSLLGPIIIVEDDPDDQEILQQVLNEAGVKNAVRFFTLCTDVIPYLTTTSDSPLLILCDVNLPGMNGLELRKKITETEYLRKKSIPFVFYSTTASHKAIIEAYEMMVQGFFVKPSNLEEIKGLLKTIIDYWKLCKHPNSM